MSLPTATELWRAGEEHLAGVLVELDGQELDAPSLLPGWSRRVVLAHVARNADAVGNLLSWARTGEPTPMYASPQARDEGIAETAELPAVALLEDCRASSRRFVQAVEALPAAAWQAEVVTAQGRTVPASEVLWMRAREVWVHSVDLDAGGGFGRLPDTLLVALIDDVHRTWQRRQQDPGTTVVAGTHTWGSGPARVTGDLPDITAWVTGRARPPALQTSGPLPVLPAWI